MVPEFYKTQRWMLELSHSTLIADIWAMIYGDGTDKWKFDMTVNELAEYFFVNKSTIIEALKFLEKNGFIEIQKSAGKKNTYRAVPKEKVVGIANHSEIPTTRKFQQEHTENPTTSCRNNQPLHADKYIYNNINSSNQKENQYNQSACAPEGNNSPSFSGTDKTATETDKTAADETFELFWNAYPEDGKFAKSYCQKLWRKIPNPRHQVKWILAAIEQLKISNVWYNASGCWVPHAENFISKQLWEKADKKQIASALASPDCKEVDQEELDQFCDEHEVKRRDKEVDMTLEEWDQFLKDYRI